MNKKFNKKIYGLVSGALVLSLGASALLTQFLTKADSNNTYNVSAIETSTSDYGSINRDTSVSVNSDGSIDISRTKNEEKTMGRENAWTIFMYLTGSNLETNEACTSEDIEEIINANFTAENKDNLTVIIQTGGAQRWHSNRISSNHISRYIYEPGEKMLTCIERLENASMGDNKTLYDFLEWGVANYASEHMAITFWNHGGGLSKGICFDENYNDDCITFHELEYVMAKLKNKMTCKFELLDFDTCLSGSIENANLMAPYAKYMIASANTAPAKGLYYTPIMNYILENPDATGEEVSKLAVDETCDFLDVALVGKSNDYSWAYYDLSKVDKVCTELNLLTNYLWEDLSKDPNNFKKHSSLISSSITYNYDSVDLGSLLYSLNNNENFNFNTSNLDAALRELVPYQRIKNKFDNEKSSIGLSFFIPQSKVKLNTFNTYRNIGFCPAWFNYIEFFNIASIYRDMTQFKATNWANSPYFFEKNFNYINYDVAYDETGDVNKTTYEKLLSNNDYASSEFPSNWYSNINIPLNKDTGCNNKTNNAVEEIGSNVDENIVAFNHVIPDTTSFMLPDGQPLTAYIIAKNETATLYSFPLLINDKESSIRVLKEINKDGSVSYSTLGRWDSTYSPYDKGFAGRGYLPLSSSCSVTPIYDIYIEDTDTFETEYGEEYNITLQNGEFDFLLTM